MSIEGLVISLTLLLITALWIAVPLINRRLRAAADEAAKQRTELLTDYDRLLDNLRDLDEDFAIGKLPASNYETEREPLVQRGIELLMALDQLDARTGHSATDESVDQVVDKAIEKAVRDYRKQARQTQKEHRARSVHP